MQMQMRRHRLRRTRVRCATYRRVRLRALTRLRLAAAISASALRDPASNPGWTEGRFGGSLGVCPQRSVVARRTRATRQRTLPTGDSIPWQAPCPHPIRSRNSTCTSTASSSRRRRASISRASIRIPPSPGLSSHAATRKTPTAPFRPRTVRSSLPRGATCTRRSAARSCAASPTSWPRTRSSSASWRCATTASCSARWPPSCATSRACITTTPDSRTRSRARSSALTSRPSRSPDTSPWGCAWESSRGTPR